jgi:hypothetical protein
VGELTSRLHSQYFAKTVISASQPDSFTLNESGEKKFSELRSVLATLLLASGGANNSN